MPLTLVALVVGGVTIALAGSGGAAAPVTKPALVFARAVNLRAVDLPRWRSLGLAPEPQPVTNTSDPEFARCVGVKPNRHVVTVESSQFYRDSFGARAELVTSKVTVVLTASLAARELATLSSARGRLCFARLIQPESTGTSGVHLRLGRVSWFPTALPAVAHGFKVRVEGTLTGIKAHNRLTHLYIDVLGFVNGPAQIYLVATGWGSPARTSTERRLLALLYGRAEAHKL